MRGASADRGMVFQEYSSFPWLTVGGNVEFGLKRSGVSRSERARVSRRLLDLVGLQGFQRVFPGQLSGGMRQRLAIARSLAMDPAILLMDEPFGAVDAQTRRTLQKEFLSIQRETGKTVCFVTHDVDEALTLRHRVVVLTPTPARVVLDRKLDGRSRSSLTGSPERDPQSARAELLELLLPRKLRAGLSDWAGHAPVLWGIDQGRLPRTVEVSTGKSGTVRKVGLHRGEYDALGITLNSLIELLPAAHGRIICSTIGSKSLGTDVIVARSEVVKSVEDLRTARLGFLRNSLEHLIFGLAIEAHGLPFELLDAERPQIVECPRNEYVDLLLRAQIDAAVLCEPSLSEIMAASGGRAFRVVRSDLDQSLVHQVVFASDEALTELRPELKEYLRWVLDLNGCMGQGRQEILAALHSQRSVGGQATGYRSGDGPYFLFDHIEYYDLAENRRLYVEREIVGLLEALCGTAEKLGIIEEAPDRRRLEQVVDSSLVRELVAEAGQDG